MKTSALILALAVAGLMAACVTAKQELATGPKPAAQSASAPVVKRPLLKAVGALDVAPAASKPAK